MNLWVCVLHNRDSTRAVVSKHPLKILHMIHTFCSRAVMFLFCFFFHILEAGVAAERVKRSNPEDAEEWTCTDQAAQRP